MEHARAEDRKCTHCPPRSELTNAFSSHGALPYESHKYIYIYIYIYQNSLSEQAWLQAELEERERAHQETRIRTLQEMEELTNKFTVPEAERTRHLRVDELSWTRSTGKSVCSESAYG